MATVYSLVCFGGLSGKTVTFTDAGDVVNLTAHGLRQGVTGIVFSTTGSLPTGITAGTTYYPRNGANADKFTIYPTKADALAGTNQRTFTGTGSGTHTVKSANMLAADLTRYGNTRVYDGIVEWNTGRSSASLYDVEVAEICDAWEQSYYYSPEGGFAITVPAGQTLVTTNVNGSWSDGFHSGRIDAGYTFRSTKYMAAVLSVAKPSTVLEGWTVKGTEEATYPLSVNGMFSGVRKFIVIGNYPSNSVGVALNRPATFIENSIIYKGGGVSVDGYQNARGARVINTLCVLGNYGFSLPVDYSNDLTIANCIAIGNATNWGTFYSGAMFFCTNNAGVTGNPQWGSNWLNITTSAFSDYANRVYTPAVGSSLIEAGVLPPGIGDIYDIAGNVRPSYKSATYPNNYWDVGPFEFDHGDGLAPRQVTLSFSGMADGSILAVYKTSDGSAIISPTAIGASGSYSTTYSYTGNVQIEVVVRKGSSGTKYLPYSSPGLITITGFSLIVNQVADGVLNG